ncbi:hypothetical protein AALP_AA5G278500 [Arabis alpina]|uniref:RRM domain-containing protein n=1 Tax=Arabis alpina TaxID=50452 RepID=A0A087GZT4_ARAAL|nr:hypothetical protein AALP_AA5G278500 [Arabis alpina]
MAYSYSSNNSDIDIKGLTVYKALADRAAGKITLYEDKLSHCFKVSVEGHVGTTSLRADDIRAIYTSRFRECGKIFNVVIPSDPSSGVVESCGFIYFFDEGGQEKALALSGTNVGFPLGERSGVTLGGWDVVVKALPKDSFEFSPDQVANARRRETLRPRGIFVSGYDRSRFADMDVIRSALFGLLSTCGEIIYLTLKEDPCQPGHLNESSFVCLAGDEARAKALRLDGSDMGGWNVVVESAEPKGARVIPANERNIPFGWEGPPGYRWKDIHPSTSH